MAQDTPDQNLSQYFAVCNDFIHAARLREGTVLIHCLAGMSRSVTVAVAYIMTCTNLNWKDALKVVRAGRAVANPNAGFQSQLQEFEMFRLSEERRRLRERFPSSALEQLDRAKCMAALDNYEELLQNKDICEGNCTKGEKCPTGANTNNSSFSSNNEASTSPSSSSTDTAQQKRKGISYMISFAVEQWKTITDNKSSSMNKLKKSSSTSDIEAQAEKNLKKLNLDEGGEEIMPNVIRYYPLIEKPKRTEESTN